MGTAASEVGCNAARVRTPVGSLQVLVEGASIGALGALWLTMQNLLGVALDDRIGGVTAPVIHRFLATEYRSEVVRACVETLALSATVGIGVGLVVGLAWLTRRRWLGVQGGCWWTRLLALTATWCCLLLWMYLYDVAARPALHQAALFERGGPRAWFQIVLSDVLGKPGVLVLGAVAIAAHWLWPLRGRSDVPVKLRQAAIAASLFGVVLVFNALGSVWHVVSKPARSDGHPNVLIIAADSLRPDRLDARRAPNIARLIDRATSFDRAYTPLARTFPAWVSMATGQYPQHHGIRHMFPRWETRERTFDTVASRFARAGYRTAVVGDFAADIFRRIDLGYQRVRTPTFTMRELVREHLLKNNPWLLAFIRGQWMRWLVPVVVEMHEATDPTAVTRDAIEEIDAAGDRPFFVTVFYSTPHFPYAAPGPHHLRFRVPGYSGPFRYAKADTLDANEVMSERDIAQVRGLYDGAVYATDEAIGTLLAELERRGQSDRTILVVTADHGEGLYEYGRSQGHGDHLQGDEPLRVPLVLVDPSKPAAHRYRVPVSLVDLAPTLLDLAHLPAFDAADGRSLTAALDGHEPESRPIYSETGLWFTELIAEVPLSRRIPYPDLTQLTEVDRKHSDQIVIRERWEPLTIAAKHRMLQEGDLRLLYLPTRSGPRFELCDLAGDPACSVDASNRYPGQLETLKAKFWHLTSSDPKVLRHGDTLMPRQDPPAHDAGGTR